MLSQPTNLRIIPRDTNVFTKITESDMESLGFSFVEQTSTFHKRDIVITIEENNMVHIKRICPTWHIFYGFIRGKYMLKHLLYKLKC